MTAGRVLTPTERLVGPATGVLGAVAVIVGQVRGGLSDLSDSVNPRTFRREAGLR